MLAPAVLLVDDDPSILELVGYTLKTRGYRVIAAADAREALEAAATYKGPILLLLTDIAMPEVSGLELASRVSLQRPETKIIYITAYGDAFYSGKHPVITKPFTTEQLLAKVQEVLAAA